MVRFVLVFFLLMLSFNTTAKEASCSAQLIPDVSDGQVIKSYLESLKQTTLFSNENVNGSYCNLHAYYIDKSPWKFYATRVLSILIILLGAMLPVVAVFPTFFKDQRVWTVGIGAAIVLSQGVLQTFHFEQSWRGQIVAQLELESALRQWQLSVVG